MTDEPMEIFYADAETPDGQRVPTTFEITYSTIPVVAVKVPREELAPEHADATLHIDLTQGETL